jgi:acetylornithine deacetylase/succinyl-diaminopimelate desuccinylase-like protein
VKPRDVMTNSVPPPSGARGAQRRRAAHSRLPLLAAALLASAPPGALHAQADTARAAIRAWRIAHEAGIVREFADLLALPNVAGDRDGIRRNADALVAMLGRRGVRARLLRPAEGSPAVFGELTVPGATRTLALYAHYDGQPVDPSQWTTPPWTPTLRERSLAEGGRAIPLPAPGDRVDPESRLYARSAGDDKVSIMAMLAALDALRASGQAPSVNLKFFFEGEEEAGSPHLREILEHHRDLLAADAWLFCDGPAYQNGRYQLIFGDRGIAGLELTVYGPTRPLHSGHYGNWAPNPAVLLANLIASMRNDDGHVRIAGFYDDVRPISPAERRALAELPALDTVLRRALGLARSEADDAPLMERLMLPALNVRGLQAGAVGAGAANVISTEARASFDFRLVPNQTPEHVRELVEAHLRSQGWFLTADSVTMAVRLAHPRIVRVQWEAGGYPASRVALDLPFAWALLRAAATGTDEPLLAVPTVGASGPTYLFEQVLHTTMLTLPIANYDDNQHAADENLRLRNLWDGIELYAAMLARVRAYWEERALP